MTTDSSNFTKHTSRNPIQRFLIDRFYEVIGGLLRPLPMKKILDAGCGEGFTLERLRMSGIGREYLGIDISSEALHLARTLFPKIPVRRENIYRIRVRDRSFDAVICSEVLEHLQHPFVALAEIRRITKRYVLLTVPWEPWFRITNFFLGKYPKTLGNHPGHLNHWSRVMFIRLVERAGFHILRTRVSFPWIIVLAER